MTGYEVYIMFLALKNHFKQDNYDYFKYNGKVPAKESTYKSRYDRWQFEKVAKRVKSRRVIFTLFLDALIEDPNVSVKEISLVIDKPGETYLERLRRLPDTFYREMENTIAELADKGLKIEDEFKLDSGAPQILYRLKRQDISYETFTMLCVLYDFNSGNPEIPLWSNMIRHSKKYSRFLPRNTKPYKDAIVKIEDMYKLNALAESIAIPTTDDGFDIEAWAEGLADDVVNKGREI